MILFLLVFSALQTRSAGLHHVTDIDDCIQKGINVSLESVISEKNLAGDTCGFLMHTELTIVVQPKKVNISKNTRIRLYLLISTNDSIIKHEVSEFFNESLFRNSIFVGVGHQRFALVVLRKDNSKDVGEFEFVFRTRECFVEMVAEDLPIFTSPNYFPDNKTLSGTLNDKLYYCVICVYEISSKQNRPFVVRFTSYQPHPGMKIMIDDLKVEGNSTFAFSGDKSVDIVVKLSKEGKTYGVFRAAVETNHSIFLLVPHHYKGYMIYNNSVVCQNSFNMKNAKVYCRYLGYPGVSKLYKSSSFHISGRSAVNLQCNGSETSPSECLVSPATTCKGDSMFGVVCQDLALAGGNDTNEGRVEIYYKGRRGLLYIHNFDVNSGNVICRQLGFKSVFKEALASGRTYVYVNGVSWHVKCKGHENSIHECPLRNLFYHQSKYFERISLVCSNTDPSRFSLVPHHHQGFMVHNNSVVCQNSFNMSNAEVYCRYLGYPGIRKLYRVSSFGVIRRPTVYLLCNGSETFPSDCRVVPSVNCGGTYVVGVVCQDMALAGGKNANEGRVEVYRKGRRGLLCNQNFDVKSGTVICRQLGFRSAIKLPSSAYKIYGSGNGRFLLYNLRCFGFEDSIHECTSDPVKKNYCGKRDIVSLVCSHKEPALFSVVPGHHEGFLVYNNYFVCRNSFDMKNAQVYCRYLGFPEMIKLHQNFAFNASGRQSVFLECNGSESSPAYCNVRDAKSCKRSSLVGVVCQDVALARGNNTKEGRVEIYYKETRTYICYIRSQIESGNVICKQLGFRFALNMTLNPTSVEDLEKGRIGTIDIRCLGNESSIHECHFSFSSCSRDRISYLVCSDKDPSTFSLVPHDHQGFMVYNTSVVCQNSFDTTNAMVYCRSLGYPGIRLLHRNSSFDMTGRSAVHLQCNGSEVSPEDCPVLVTESCEGNSTVEVVCQDVALAGGNNTNEGHVEIYNRRRKGLLCRYSFDINAGHVICRQLGFSWAVNVTLRAGDIYGSGEGPFLLNNLYCLGYENSIHECPSKSLSVESCMWRDVVGVVCSNQENIEKQEEIIQIIKSVLKRKKEKLYILKRSIKHGTKRNAKLNANLYAKLKHDIRKIESELKINEAKLLSMKTKKTKINN